MQLFAPTHRPPFKGVYCQRFISEGSVPFLARYFGCDIDDRDDRIPMSYFINHYQSNYVERSELLFYLCFSLDYTSISLPIRTLSEALEARNVDLLDNALARESRLCRFCSETTRRRLDFSTARGVFLSGPT